MVVRSVPATSKALHQRTRLNVWQFQSLFCPLHTYKPSSPFPPAACSFSSASKRAKSASSLRICLSTCNN